MKTEIFGTFGPACATEEILKQMIQNGMTGMRLNLSHTALEDSREMVENYHRAAKAMGINPQILIDMQGPELRVGALREEMILESEERICLVDVTAYEAGNNQTKCIPVPAEVLTTIEAGDEILLDDGKILLQAEAQKYAKVCRGGVLRSHKSIKVVGKQISLPVLTEHDISNIKHATEYGVTALMQPFVLSGDQLEEVRGVLKEHGAEAVKIYAKIENRIGASNLENIIPKADVIIIARGDLGNDMPLWELPAMQKKIEVACKKANKPYIVVTQMLASMETNPVPTRAEVSDIYHAVYHGAWGLMLTGETAVGQYPVEAIRYLANTAQMAEEK